MTTSFFLPPPTDWQTFERLCRDLFGAIYDTDMSSLVGRQGQKQRGVDIIVIDRRNTGDHIGIQCKLKDPHSNKQLSHDEIEAETRKAREFTPQLTHLIIATTLQKCSQTEEIVRQISNDNSREGYFTVSIYAWGDITHELGNHDRIIKKYYPHTQLKNYDAELFDHWYNNADICNLEKHIHYAFYRHDIEFFWQFISQLESYIESSTHTLKFYSRRHSGDDLIEYIELFIRISKDFIHALTSTIDDTNPLTANTRATYRIKLDDMQYNERSFAIYYHTYRIRELLYHMVCAANLIISTYMASETQAQRHVDMIPFRYTEKFVVHTEYPQYTDKETNWYPGLEEIENICREYAK